MSGHYYYYPHYNILEGVRPLKRWRLVTGEYEKDHYHYRHTKPNQTKPPTVRSWISWKGRKLSQFYFLS